MSEEQHKSYVYVGLGGESPLLVGSDGPALDQGGLYRRGDGDETWDSVSQGLPVHPQVRAILNQSQGGMCIYNTSVIGLGFSQKSFGL